MTEPYPGAYAAPAPPPADERILALILFAKILGSMPDDATPKRISRGIYRAIAILRGAPMTKVEARTDVGHELARQRRVGVRLTRNSARMKKRPLPKLSAQDEAWRKKAIEAGEYEPAAAEEKPAWAGLVAP